LVRAYRDVLSRAPAVDDATMRVAAELERLSAEHRDLLARHHELAERMELVETSRSYRMTRSLGAWARRRD
jgi:hypothetical protein